MNLLQMSLTGAILIVVIAAIRALAMNHLPKKTFLILWGIVLLRLLLPFSVPSVFSIYTLFQNHICSTERITVDTDLLVPMEHMSFISNTPHTPSVLPSFSIWEIIWGIGVLLCVLFFAITYRKCYKEFQTAIPVDHPFAQRWLSTHPLRRTLSICQSGLISAPLTYGIFHPVILMPKTTEWENKDQLEYVLAHEYIHILRFDTTKKLILTIALCVHWFNPLVWVMYILANRDMELSCDEVVIHWFGESRKSAYARMLIRMEETKSGFTPLCNNFGKNSIEERIEAIMKKKKTTALSMILAASLVIGTTTVFATSATVRHPKSDDSLEYENITSVYHQNTGETFYTDKDGNVLSETEYKKRYPMDEIEWWTYEEYKEWIEKEKKLLPTFIGQKAWANGEEFIWTQERIDKAIAMYEEELQEIKKGAMISKTVNGNDDIGITINPSKSPDVQTEITINPSKSFDIETDIITDINSNQKMSQEDILSLYGEDGISFDKNGKMLFQGEMVRYFYDGVEMEHGMYSVRYEYLNKDGVMDVHTVRSTIKNKDGSVNPFGDLIKIEKDSKEVFDKRKFNQYDTKDSFVSNVVLYSNHTNNEDMIHWDKILSKYAKFGIRYESGHGLGNVYYNGKPVKTFIDQDKQGNAIVLSSNDGGDIVVRVVYDAEGNVTGIKTD